MTDLQGAVVLVVGATGGLGSRIARQLREAGATVVSSGRLSPDLDVLLADLRDPTSATTVVTKAIQRHRRLDGLVVTLSGSVADAPTAGLAAYSASKAGLRAFAQAATRELRRSGVRVLDARPGHVETNLAKRPIAGQSPTFPPGLDPDVVARRIVRAIIDGERDLPGAAFGPNPA